MPEPSWIAYCFSEDPRVLVFRVERRILAGIRRFSDKLGVVQRDTWSGFEVYGVKQTRPEYIGPAELEFLNTVLAADLDT